MITKKNKIRYLLILCWALINVIVFGDSTDNQQLERQEYSQELSNIKAKVSSFTPGQTNDLNNFEKFAEEIQSKWKQRNKELYARLNLELCGQLSSGRFNNYRQYSLSRKYALSALEDPNQIPLTLELELSGHVNSLVNPPNAPLKGVTWAKQRKKDVEIRIHAWKRLLDSIDPKWDPNEVLYGGNIIPPAATGLPAGVDPNAIEDPNLRAEYERVIEENQKKNEKWNEQYQLRKWLKRFPKHVESYIITAYSMPPYDLDELNQNFKNFNIGEETKAHIFESITKNIENQKELKERLKAE